MRRLYILLIAILLVPLAQSAQENDNNGDEQFNELIEDAKKFEGFLTFYRKDSNLYLALTEAELDRDFILNFKISAFLIIG